MVIDDKNLDSIISDLVNKINKNSLERKTLQNIYANAMSIQLINVRGQEGKIIPTDPKLGVEITEDRRQAIYDRLVSDVAKL